MKIFNLLKEKVINFALKSENNAAKNFFSNTNNL